MKLNFDAFNGFGNFGSDIITVQPNGGGSAYIQSDDSEEEAQETKHGRRRTTAIQSLSKHYILRRAFSEVSLLEAMEYEKLTKGNTYLFITAGDVDALSYLKIALNQARTLDYVLLSTWVMAGEDIYQVKEWMEEGRIKKIDFYFGEIYPNSYRIEFQMVKQLYEKYPEVGRVAVFKNHSKTILAVNESQDFYFYAALSCNINTNPRTENGAIVLDKGVYEWAKEYYDGIRSFEK